MYGIPYASAIRIFMDRSETMEKRAFLRDRQTEKPLLRCAFCTGEIYAGERYYDMEEGAVCWGCLILYARRCCAGRMRIAGSAPEEAG